jgi:hypothetical protein
MNSKQENIACLIKYANLVYQDLTATGSVTDEAPTPDIVSQLALPIARLTKLLIANSHQKLDEVIFAAENNLTVSPHQHGTDLFDEQKTPIELKVSVVTRSNKHTAHFNWNIPGKGTVAIARRHLLLENLKQKIEHGKAILLIKSGNARQVAKFTLSYAFLKEYFTRIAIGTSDKHLMSAAQCRKCHLYHRFVKYQEASDAMEKGGKVDWIKILSVTRSQCS